ncbi:hypothetical protein [Clostridium sp. Marseille-Q2269]|uniref:hypothetical protein n=1 Tax=Clostridium sp. Marseille-Q2269 TaxID=2942205 RepID=UPI00207420E3|nr:hypothetical protein [Clostridium sp. Marseille-Q2269]
MSKDKNIKVAFKNGQGSIFEGSVILNSSEIRSIEYDENRYAMKLINNGFIKMEIKMEKNSGERVC